MSLILIDRRQAARHKSSNNRQKLLRRVRSFIKNSMPANIAKGNSLGSNSSTGHLNSSPVKIAKSALEEPFFAYSNDGYQQIVLPGNDRLNRGDEVFDSTAEQSDERAGVGESGEDDFIINVARDEFLDLFFEDCELPNLKNERVTEKLENKFSPAGFSKNGSPAQLSVIRSYKQSLARRWAAMLPFNEEREALEAELQQLEATKLTADSPDELARQERVAKILARLKEIAFIIERLDNFDRIDMRYKKREAKPLRTIESVLIMIMDISGSMGLEEKTIARRWFALLYAFIKRRYANTDLIFIAHTDEAMELNENDFFSTRINGGTMVSPALALANKLILERYDPNETSIYISHASDGDNWDSDNQNVIDELLRPNGLLNKIQMFSYVEVGKKLGGGWITINMSKVSSDKGLWAAYAACQEKQPPGKMLLAEIETPDGCYSVFKRQFKKTK